MARNADPERIARKREHIAVAAGRLFATHGYEATSVALVAAEAEISAASVFYYFSDKAALFRAVFEQDLPTVESLMAEWGDAADAVEGILAILDALVEDAAEPGAAGMVVELVRRVKHDPQLMEIVTRTGEVVRTGLASLIARGQSTGSIDPALEPERAAAWLQTIVDGAYLGAEEGRAPTAEVRRTALGYLRAPSGKDDSD
ncbi:MAG TPA: TetR/AcrR family transcriptional regulator [Candidatus Agrococcus pullicola]|uniref:TetR/AcrR family transcriptional regulator n=1 Tax=Candidatus Agrococcus pullicola TaxID=2838429 RepID=A0A9D2C912_9MICO|nr:TetR/AcrR family transcriptional regulator [Candidatus Agrococcus pullicola]